MFTFSMKRNTIIKWVLLVLLVSYSVGMVIWARGEAEKHTCIGIEIEVKGNVPMDTIIRKGVKQGLDKYPERIVGTPLTRLNTRRIEDYINSLNNFESVDCMITSDGRLKVSIMPLIPVMRVFFKDKSYYINKSGKQMDSKAEFYSDVPVVQGDFNSEFTPRHVLPLVRFIVKDEELKNIVSMIVARNAGNLMIVPKVKGHIVNFGDTSRLAEKWRALRTFYHKVMPYKGWEEYDTISVKFKGQVVATRRNKAKMNHGENYVEDVDPEEASLPSIEASDTKQKENKPENSDNTGV